MSGLLRAIWQYLFGQLPGALIGALVGWLVTWLFSLAGRKRRDAELMAMMEKAVAAGIQADRELRSGKPVTPPEQVEIARIAHQSTLGFLNIFTTKDVINAPPTYGQLKDYKDEHE
jgi:prepilin signal peptidase PulO-like enzyme (type II secretory pathway)